MLWCSPHAREGHYDPRVQGLSEVSQLRTLTLPHLFRPRDTLPNHGSSPAARAMRQFALLIVVGSLAAAPLHAQTEGSAGRRTPLFGGADTFPATPPGGVIQHLNLPRTPSVHRESHAHLYPGADLIPPGPLVSRRGLAIGGAVGRIAMSSLHFRCPPPGQPGGSGRRGLLRFHLRTNTVERVSLAHGPSCTLSTEQASAAATRTSTRPNRAAPRSAMPPPPDRGDSAGL